MKKDFISLAVVMALGLSTVQAERFFVKPDGSGEGTSWEDATSLVNALDWAMNDGDEIFVAKGEYTGSFKTSNAITVYGECNGNETEPPVVISAEGLKTTLKGPGKKRVLLVNNAAATFIGFNITGGDATTELVSPAYGGGVYLMDGGATLRYCRIHDNYAVDGNEKIMGGAVGKAPQQGIGGGAYVLNGRLEYCIIENNHAVVNPWSNPDYNNCWSMGVGGGICLESLEGKNPKPENAVVTSCIIRNNGTTPSDDDGSYTSRGGGIAIKSGILASSLVYGNAVNGSNNNGNIGGGVALVEKDAKVINCTVYGNSVKGLGGGISFQTQNATIKNASVSNCIVWGNTGRQDSYGIDEGKYNYNNIRFTTNSAVANNGLNSDHSVTISTVICPDATVSATAITDDPMLTNVAANDYTLQEGSPAIDAGDDPAIAGFDKDLLGNNRIAGNAVDVGCYEFGSTGAPELPDVSGIEAITEADGAIIATTYYTLQGMEVSQPTTSGIYIVKNTYESLRTSTQKVLISME